MEIRNGPPDGSGTVSGNFLHRNFVYCIVHRLVTNSGVKIAILVLMALSSAGYTTVLSYCTMSQTFDCCCGEDQPAQPTDASTGASLGSGLMPCNLHIVAGGLTPVALNASPEVNGKMHPPDLGIQYVSPAELPRVSYISLLGHTDDIAPPDVGLYLRTGALLI